MQPKQRYLAALAGEPVDFLPRVPILMQFAAEFIGSNYGAFASDHRVLVEANLRALCEPLKVFSQPGNHPPSKT